MFSNFIIIIRRLLLLYTAMFIVGRPWVSILLFMTQNLASLAFLASIQPYLSRTNNYLNIINESVSLIVSYFIIQVGDERYSPEQNQKMGNYIVFVIYSSWAINLVIIMITQLFILCRKFKVYYYKKL